MRGHRDLEVWQKSMDLVVGISKLTASFPKTETYGLASQMQRAAVSIPSNIAEGHGLKQTQAFLRHLAIASGSLTELETQLHRAGQWVHNNIAEGHGLKQTQAYLRHLAIANGSLAELETQLEIAQRLGYIVAQDKSLMSQDNEVGRMLAGLRRSLQCRLDKPES